MEMMVEIFDFERLAMRRLLLAHTMLKIASQYGANSTRSIWMKTRRQMFWEIDCQVNSDAFFKSNFRMKRQSFNKLCIMLKGLERKNTNYRKSIQLEKRIAIAVYALGSSADYRTIGNMFGIGKSSVCTILIEFCREVWRCLWPLYLNKFPMNEIQLREYLNGFESLGFPQVLGAIDGCHIEVHPTAEDAVDYYNDKGWYSTVLLALVDARCRFIYINVGSPGGCNDSSIFESSSLKCQLVQSSLFNDLSRQISSVNVPVVLLGDSAFKLDEHLMKPYPFRKNQPLKEKIYNNALSKCHRVVETAFDHLKARFRRVGKGFENHMANTKSVIKACCVLHNFLNEENDEINERWIAAQQIENQTRQLPENEPNIPGNVSPRAEEIRQAFVSYFGEGSKPLFQRDDIVVNPDNAISIAEDKSGKQSTTGDISNRWRKERHISTDSSSPERYRKYQNNQKKESEIEPCDKTTRRTKTAKSISDDKYAARRNASPSPNRRRNTPEKIPYFVDQVRERDRIRRKYGSTRNKSPPPSASSKFRRRRSISRSRSRSHSRDSRETKQRSPARRTNFRRRSISMDREWSDNSKREREREKSRADKDLHGTPRHYQHRSDDRSKNVRRSRSSRTHSRSRTRSRERSSRIGTQNSERHKYRYNEDEEQNGNGERNLSQPQIITIPVPVPADFMNYGYPTWPTPTQWAPQSSRYGTPTYPMPTFVPAVLPPLRHPMPPYGLPPQQIRYGRPGYRLPAQYGATRPWRPNFRSKNT